MTRRISTIACAILSMAAVGCDGGDDDVRGPGPRLGDGGVVYPDGGPVEPPCTDSICVGQSWVPRLTNTEYGNIMLDTFGMYIDGSSLPADGSLAGRFWSNDQERLQPDAVGNYQTMAESVAGQLVTATYHGGAHDGQPMLTVLLAPVPQCTHRDAACASALASYYGRRLYRRPLTTDELASYTSLYAWETTTATDAEYVTGGSGTFVDGIRVMFELMLQSPGMLYRVEQGTPTAQPNVVALTSTEMAARLAAFVWRSVPDDTLIAAADADQLRTPQQIEMQVRRMIDTPRTGGGSMWMWFAEQWMNAAALDTTEFANLPDGATWTDRTPRSLHFDINQFVDHIARDPATGDMHTLFTSAGGNYQDSIDWITGTAGAHWTWTDSMPHRHGLLTLPGVLIANAKPDFVAPLYRGLFVRTAILCQHIDPPPDSLRDSIAAISSSEHDMPHGATARERLTAITQRSEPCVSCHSLTNQVGYGFSTYDDFGRYRDHEIGVDGMSYTIDSSGSISPGSDGTHHTDIDGPFTGADELVDRLADSAVVAQCLTRQLTRFALLREPQSVDQPSLDHAYGTFDGSGRQLVELAVAISQTDAFRHRRLPH